MQIATWTKKKLSTGKFVHVAWEPGRSGVDLCADPLLASILGVGSAGVTVDDLGFVFRGETQVVQVIPTGAVSARVAALQFVTDEIKRHAA